MKFTATLATITTSMLAGANALALPPNPDRASIASLPLCATINDTKGQKVITGSIVAADKATLCRGMNSPTSDVLYPVLQPDGTAKMTLPKQPSVPPDPAVAAQVPQEAADGFDKFRSAKPQIDKDKGAYDLIPEQVRKTTKEMFDNNRFEYTVGNQTRSQAIAPCDPKATPKAGMDQAVWNICSNKTDKGTTYKVPSGVDCKTGAITYKDSGDRLEVMTAMSNYRAAASVCSNPHLAASINSPDAIGAVNGHNKVGTLAGDHGPAMKAAQMMLKQLNVDPSLKVDGLRGDDTRNALLAFQATNKLPQTGVLDATTLKTLNEQYQATNNQLPKSLRGQIGRMTAQEPPLPGQRPSDFASMTTDQIKALKPDQISKLSPEQFRALKPFDTSFSPGSSTTSPDQKAAYDKRRQELGIIGIDQVKALTPQQIGKMTAVQFKALKPFDISFSRDSTLTSADQKAAYLKRKQELGL